MHLQPVPGTSAVIMNPPKLHSGFICSKDLFLLHSQNDISSQLVVLSRIILTSCHSSIHTLAGSQTLHVLYYIPESLYIHIHPVNTVFPSPGVSVCSLPEAIEHTVFFTKLHVHVSFQEESPPQHRYLQNHFSDSISDRHHWSCSQCFVKQN